MEQGTVAQATNWSLSAGREIVAPILHPGLAVGDHSRGSRFEIEDPSPGLRLEYYRVLAATDPLSLLYEIERYRGPLEVVYLLRRQGPVTKSELRKHVKPSERAIGHALRFLQSSGMVSLRREKGWPFAMSYRLTERGQRFADTFVDAWLRIFRD
jgi:DNA-binding HxlR family transcriptional regulator